MSHLNLCPDSAGGLCPRGDGGAWCCARQGSCEGATRVVAQHLAQTTWTWGGGGGGARRQLPLPPRPGRGISADEAIRAQWRATIARWRAEEAGVPPGEPALALPMDVAPTPDVSPLPLSMDAADTHDLTSSIPNPRRTSNGQQHA